MIKIIINNSWAILNRLRKLKAGPAIGEPFRPSIVRIRSIYIKFIFIIEM